jgi:hypothetical protein
MDRDYLLEFLYLDLVERKRMASDYIEMCQIEKKICNLTPHLKKYLDNGCRRC